MKRSGTTTVLSKCLVVLSVKAKGFVYPSVHACERSSRCRPIELQIGMMERPQRSDVAPTVGVEGLSCDVDVLLRHRLPRQSSVSQRPLAVVVESDFTHPTRTQPA